MNNILIIATLFINILTPTFTTETIPVEPGTYSVHISYNGEEGSAEKTIRTTIGSDNFFNVNDIAIDAQDIYTTKHQELNSAFLLTESKAKAWNLKNDEVYQIEKINVEEMDSEHSIVTFTTLQNVSTKINVYIVDRKELYMKQINEPIIQYEKVFLVENFIDLSILMVLFILVFMSYIGFFISQFQIIKQKQIIVEKINKRRNM